MLDLEKRRLHDAGRLDLESKVEWISKSQSDGAGYDLRSFEETGDELFIEVKTTKGPVGAPFYVTENERLCSEEHAMKYRLYRVFQFKKIPKLYRLKGTLNSALRMEPKLYRATCLAQTPAALVP